MRLPLSFIVPANRRQAASALLFAAAFVFWNYYPHGLPLPTLFVAWHSESGPGALRPFYQHRY
jgi:hypothetical protein